VCEKRSYVQWLLPGQSSYPCTAIKVGFTVCDNQTRISVRIMEASRGDSVPDSDRPEDHHELNSFIIEGLPAKPAGQGSVESTFAIDENGILVVSACDTANRNNKMTVTVQSYTMQSDPIEKASRDVFYSAPQLAALASATRYRAAYVIDHTKCAQMNRPKLQDLQTDMKALMRQVEAFEPKFTVQEIQRWEEQANVFKVEAQKLEGQE